MLDPLDKELESRGHKFARYADDFVVMLKSAKAAGRVMASLIRFAEDKLELVVNRVKSQTAPLKACAFLGFQIGPRGKAAWTATCAHCGSNFTTGQKPESDRNRRMRTRMSGGVGPVADLLV